MPDRFDDIAIIGKPTNRTLVTDTPVLNARDRNRILKVGMTERLFYIGYILISAYALFLDSIAGFYVLAVCVGFFQGTIQALSRSYFGRMVPKEKTGEYFGILDVFGKGATIIGTLLIAILIQMLGQIRIVAVVLLVMFAIGLVFFRASVKEKIYDANSVNGE